MAVISRRRAGFTISPTSVLAVVLFAASLAGLAALRDGSGVSPLRASEAEQAALKDARVRAAVRTGFTRVRAMPLDDRMVRVSFFDGPQAVAEAAVRPDGGVEAVIEHDGVGARVGSSVGQSLPVLAGMLVLFLAATLRLPLRSRQNLDAAALAGVAVPIVLLNERYLEMSVLTGTVLLAYLAWRCVTVARGRAGRPDEGVWLMDRLSGRARGMVAAAASAGLVLLAIPGGLVSDVGFASLAGATELLDGRLPYGNLPMEGLVHGDTYPLLAYVAYVPAAVISPVRDGFDPLEGALWVSAAFALLAARAMGRLGGARTAIAFLAFPPVMVAASSGSNDVVAAAFVAGALATAVRAGASTAALSIAGWVKLGPLAIVPLWLARYRRRALLCTVAVAAALGAVVLMLGGAQGIGDMVLALRFQSERGSLMSPWALLDVPAAQIAFQAAVLTGIALATISVWRDRAARDPRRMAALGAAVLLGVELAANHWSPTYLVWVFPLVAVALLRPSRPRAPAPAA